MDFSSWGKKKFGDKILYITTFTDLELKEWELQETERLNIEKFYFYHKSKQDAGKTITYRCPHARDNDDLGTTTIVARHISEGKRGKGE